MIKSYFTIAFRNIRRNLSYAFLNIFGLSLGIAACLVIFLIVRNELNYDNYSKADRIYRVTWNAIDFNSNVSLAVAPKMRNDFPELEQVSQVMYSKEVMVKVDNKRFRDKDFVITDQHLPQIFDFQWIKGDPKTALAEPNAIVLNETLAKKYFGDADPIGKIINVENQINAKVTGVIKDIPANRSVPIQMMLSFESIRNQVKDAMNQIYDIGGGFFTFILLPKNYPIQRIQSRIPDFINKNWALNPKEVRLPMQALRDIHFDQRYINNVVTPVSKDTFYALFGVALLIIVTASINFVNLATAQAIRRAKEVGVRKVLGANRSQLIKQFLGETTVLVAIALVAGVGLAAFFLSGAVNWLGVRIDARELAEPVVVLWIAGLTITVIIIAGLYPAFVQSAYQPIDSLKNKIGRVGRGFTLRKSLVVAQFAISQILIVGTLIVAHQMDFFENQDLGFNKDAVVSVSLPDMKQGETFRQQLMGTPGVKQVCFSTGAPSYANSAAGFTAPAYGIVKDDIANVVSADENYIDMFGLKMLAGEKLRKSDVKDTAQNYIVNETLIHKLGITDPAKALGAHIILNGRYSTITGVVQDYQEESKHKKRRSVVIEYQPKYFFVANIKIQPTAMPQTISRIQKDWSALFPDNLFVSC